jgi:hypothetical protein
MAQKQQKDKSRGLMRNRHGPEATEVEKQRPHEEQAWPISNRSTKAEAS